MFAESQLKPQRTEVKSLKYAGVCVGADQGVISDMDLTREVDPKRFIHLLGSVDGVTYSKVCAWCDLALVAYSLPNC